jgi:hypothetical protein
MSGDAPGGDPLGYLADEDAAAFAAGYSPKPRTPLTDIPVPPPARIRRPGRLFWTIPLAVLIAAPLFVFAELSLCGIYSCEGGGFGPTFGLTWLTWLLCFVIGGIFAVAVGAVPWTRTRNGQAYAAIVTGSIVTIVLMAYFYEQLY